MKGKTSSECFFSKVVGAAQDSSSLLGHMSLAQVLRKRSCVPVTPPDQAGPSTDVESVGPGFADLALTGLALSDQSRQRDFAQQVTLELMILF